jgi:hypothetical protein
LYKGSKDSFVLYLLKLTLEKPLRIFLSASSFVLPKQAKGLRTEKCFAFFGARLAIQLSKSRSCASLAFARSLRIICLYLNQGQMTKQKRPDIPGRFTIYWHYKRLMFGGIYTAKLSTALVIVFNRLLVCVTNVTQEYNVSYVSCQGLFLLFCKVHRHG